MIISCPSCGARYRLNAAPAEPTRMRCAACDHRWIAEAEVEAPPSPVPEPAPEPPPIEAVVPERDEQTDEEPADAPRSAVLRTIVAVILGGALTIAAGALWVVRIDPAELPLFGAEIAALAPAPLPLEVRFTARTTALPSGDRLLEISGTVTNSGAATVTLPELEARLATPAGTMRRWRIAAPASRLAPGGTVAFTSTATGFPADATIVAIRPSR